MVTGDNKDTAEAIAVECGIITKTPNYNKAEHVWIGEDFWNKIGGIKSVDKVEDGIVKKDKFNNPVKVDSIKH